MAVGLGELRAWLDSLAEVYSENRQRLTDLDSPIGDADHGINLDRGFAAVKAEMSSHPAPDIRSLLQTTAMVLIRTVGGAAGPLYGTFFLRAAAACAGRTELDAAGVVELFRAGVEGVRQRGKAEPGDKTMVDALEAALDAMRTALGEGAPLAAILDAG
ncbi:MAG TPA: dihydroxyacetone kinase subunit DhaL, partial [Bryobacteraceae bacterium]|nr:dihydroxyacetone kinase subunit DhaL [Bryobacteraceae bacterium]